MRILTSIGCTLALFPLLGTTVQANSTEITQEEAVSPSKTELLQQQQWETKAESLTNNNSDVVAQDDWTGADSVDSQEVENTFLQLQGISTYNFVPNRGSPSLTIANPSGFGSDRGQFFSGFSYQTDTRYGSGENESQDDGSFGFGYAFGNARKAVGAEISYTMASFGSSRDFGTGGFNAKVHRQFPGNWGVAAGWNGFLNLGDDNDFEDSLYLTTTKIFKTREKLNSAFSRMAVTVGVGNGQFRTEDAIEDGDEGFNVFGSLAFRIATPVSGIVEWTGQDLAIGTSVSPFKRVPVTFNISVRDLAGAGDEPRVILGVGTGF